jgi:hypothetical protein
MVRRWRLVVAGLAFLVIVQAAGLFVALRSEWGAQRTERGQMTFWRKPGVAWREQVGGPVVRPATVAADQAGIAPDAEVVGIEVGGKARAYLLDSLRDPRGHLVNDVVGRTPVSVVFCDLSKCLRVYAGALGSAPLGLEVAGVLNSELVLKSDGGFYFQQSGEPVEPGAAPGPLPYRTLIPERTTWDAWRRRYPQTDVYVGAERSSGRAGRPPGPAAINQSGRG